MKTMFDMGCILIRVFAIVSIPDDTMHYAISNFKPASFLFLGGGS